MNEGTSTANFIPPSFRDDYETDWYTLDNDRESYIIFKSGHENDNLEDLVICERLTNNGTDHEWSFTRTPYNIEASIELVMCYSYDGIEQLQDLCDYENSFTLEDAIGTCFRDLTL